MSCWLPSVSTCSREFRNHYRSPVPEEHSRTCPTSRGGWLFGDLQLMTTSLGSSEALLTEASVIPTYPLSPAAEFVPAADVANVQSLTERLKRSLEQADTFEEVKDVRDQAEVLRGYLRKVRAGLREQNKVAEIKIRAERRLGEELARLPKATPRGSNQHKDRSHDVTDPPTLADLDVSKAESS